MPRPSTTNSLGALAGIAITALSCHAQSVETLVALKAHLQVQSDAAGTISGDEWYAEFSVDGVDLETISPAPAVSGPITLEEPYVNGGLLGWNEDWQEWNFGWPNFNGWAVSSRTELDSLFGNGTYEFSQDGVPFVSVNLTGDAYPAEAPILTLEGGEWRGGRYLVDPRADVFRATTAVWSEFGTGLLEVITLEILDTEFRTESWSTEGGPANVAIEVPNAAFIPGAIAEMQALNSIVVDFVPEIPDLPGAMAAALYESEIVVEVVIGKPEDLDLDGTVGASDIGALLVQWGPCKRGCDADLDGDGSVGASDIGALLVAWGSYL